METPDSLDLTALTTQMIDENITLKRQDKAQCWLIWLLTEVIYWLVSSKWSSSAERWRKQCDQMFLSPSAPSSTRTRTVCGCGTAEVPLRQAATPEHLRQRHKQDTHLMKGKSTWRHINLRERQISKDTNHEVYWQFPEGHCRCRHLVGPLRTSQPLVSRHPQQPWHVSEGKVNKSRC